MIQKCTNVYRILKGIKTLALFSTLDSKRVWRLAGLLQEASGEIEYAEDNYNENIRNDPGDAASIKRIVSLYKHQGTDFQYPH